MHIYVELLALSFFFRYRSEISFLFFCETGQLSLISNFRSLLFILNLVAYQIYIHKVKPGEISNSLQFDKYAMQKAMSH